MKKDKSGIQLNKIIKIVYNSKHFILFAKNRKFSIVIALKSTKKITTEGANQHNYANNLEIENQHYNL